MTASGFDDATVPVRAPHVAWVVLDGEAVLHDTLAGTLHRLNPSATTVWEACDGSARVAAIVESLHAAFSGPAEAIGNDVRDLLASLGDSGLIVAAPDDATP